MTARPHSNKSKLACLHQSGEGLSLHVSSSSSRDAAATSELLRGSRVPPVSDLTAPGGEALCTFPTRQAVMLIVQQQQAALAAPGVLVTSLRHLFNQICAVW